MRRRIGEISLLKDMAKAMELQEKAEQEDAAEIAQKSPTKDSIDANLPVKSGHLADSVDESSERSPAYTEKVSLDAPIRGRVERLQITAGEEASMDGAGMTTGEKDLRKTEKRKGGLTKEQREELHAYELERLKVRQERISTLARKLEDRISVWTESDRSSGTTHAFEMKCKYEAENLKLESFGVELLQAIGAIYIQKATLTLKSQKFMGSFFGKMKEKGTVIKDTWETISVAVDAQMTADRMAKMEEKGGEDWTPEVKMEFEEQMTGKVLAASWVGTKYEIGGVLRDVCDVVLNKSVPKEKRLQRAQALLIMGNIFHSTQADPDDQGRVFETLMARSQTKAKKKPARKEKSRDSKVPSTPTAGSGSMPSSA